MNENGIALVYDEESHTWGIKKEPYMTIEVETKEDFDFLQEAVKLAKEIVHGEWLVQGDGTHYCSKCGRDATFTHDGTEVLGLACPYCMAIMNGGSVQDERC